MPIIEPPFTISDHLTLVLRLVAGLVWLGTVIRRITSGLDEFENRISEMGDGSTFFPKWFMDFAIANWWIFFVTVFTLELFSSLSLLSGTLARGGALLATINGFAIGMAGVGLGINDLLIPWSAAIVTLFLLLFTHPGRYMGLDVKLHTREMPRVLLIFT